MKKVLLMSLILLAGFLGSGCFEMKDSGRKSQNENLSASDSREELASLRASNRHLSRENEDLKTVNAEMLSQLKNLGKRDEQLSRKIVDLNADLRQRILLTDALLEKNKTCEAKIEELQANLDAWKKKKSTAATPR